MPATTTTIPQGESETVTLLPEDAAGDPATIRSGNVPAWANGTPAIATVTPAADGLSAVVKALTQGTTTVTVTAISDFNDGDQLTGTFTVTVPEGPATGLTFQFGTPA